MSHHRQEDLGLQSRFACFALADLDSVCGGTEEDALDAEPYPYVDEYSGSPSGAVDEALLQPVGHPEGPVAPVAPVAPRSDVEQAIIDRSSDEASLRLETPDDLRQRLLDEDQSGRLRSFVDNGWNLTQGDARNPDVIFAKHPDAGGEIPFRIRDGEAEPIFHYPSIMRNWSRERTGGAPGRGGALGRMIEYLAR